MSEKSEGLKDRCGQKTEVWSRVVGYYQRLDTWNKGKREEFKKRRTYLVPKHEDLKK